MAKQTFTTGQVLTAAQVTALQTNQYNQTVTTQTTSYVLVAADVGTRVYMNAAGATTITVNTGVFAAGDTVWLGNIGAGSCVVTAGTATVSKFSTASLTLSQYQGAYLYFVSTGVAILYSDSAGASTPLTTKGDLFGYDTANARIPIGTNNQVLTADSAQALGLKWATPTAVAASYSLINSGGTALTGAGTITVSGISGIGSLMVLVKGASSASASSEITMRFNSDSAANYNTFGMSNTVSTSYTVSNFSVANNLAATTIYWGRQDSSAAGAVYGFLNMTGCNSTGIKAYTAGSSGDGGSQGAAQNNLGGTYTGTSTISSVSIISSVGNFDAGTIYVYGSA